MFVVDRSSCFFGRVIFAVLVLSAVGLSAANAQHPGFCPAAITATTTANLTFTTATTNGREAIEPR
jgi:hypothetical protein